MQTDNTFMLKSEVANACGVASPQILRRLIEPLITSGSISWDNPWKQKGKKGGKKLITRRDCITIMTYLRGEE